MPEFRAGNVISIGEAMVEMAPTGDHTYRQGFAGDTFNTAWHMAQLLAGYRRVGFFTRVGRDRLSQRFATELAADGLDVAVIHRDSERQMGLYLIELDGVERSFHYWRSDSAARRLADDMARLTAGLDGAALIHVSGITLAILPPDGRENLFSALSQARRAGSMISFDPNVRPRLWPSADDARQTIRTMLALTDMALPSFDDEKALWGDEDPTATIARCQAFGIRDVVVKDGANVVHFASGSHVGHRATPPVADVKDTTGAGDAFNAGYLAARLVGLNALPSIGFGQALSAGVIRTLGARAPRASVHDLGRRLQQEFTND